MVFNPAGRRLTVGSKTNPRRRRRRRPSRRRRNPVGIVKVARRRNPIRRRRNPSSTSGLLVAAVMAGVGVTVFDLLVSRFAPQSSALVRTGIKLGGAYAIQNWGGKVPLLGKHKNDIALVLAVAGVVDLLKLYVLPQVSQVIANVGLLPASTPLAAGDETMGNIYGNAYPSDYRSSRRLLSSLSRGAHRWRLLRRM